MVPWLLLVACRLPASNGHDEPAGNGDLEVDTAAVEFDPLDIGTDPPASQHVWLQNVGSAALYLLTPRIEGDEAFRSEGRDIVLEPFDSYGFDVVFDPQTPFSHDATLLLQSDVPGATKVALHGDGVAPVIEVGGSTLTMPSAYVGCRVVNSVSVQNTGNETLEVTPSLVGSSELTLVDGGDVLEIAPGQEASIEVAYEAPDKKGVTATLTLDSNDPIHPQTEIEVTGAGGFLPTNTDSFERGGPAADIVFVVDNSGSMSQEQPELVDSIGSFVDALAASGVDYKIGVITSDTSSLEYDVVTSSTTNPTAVLADQIANIGTGGAGTTPSIQMLYNCVQPGGDCSAAAGFLRDDALLDAIVVSDDPDQSALTPEGYVEYLWTLKSDPDLVRIDAIAGSIPTVTCGTCSSPGFGFDAAVEVSGGMYLDICGDWDDNLALLGSSELSPAYWRFPLSETPIVDTIEVFVDGAPVPAVPGTWAYVDNAIEFDHAAMPPPGTSVEVRYTVADTCG